MSAIFNVPMCSVHFPWSANSRLVRRGLNAYWGINWRIWNRLPPTLRLLAPGRAYGRHLHALVRLQAERQQYFATFFLRNRPELELMRRLLDQKPQGSCLAISILACSKGAEVYSILWTIRTARPDLRLNVHAVDVSHEILEFAQRGLYSLKREEPLNHGGMTETASDVTAQTWKDQNAPIFERMTDEEIESMCDLDGNQVKVKPWLKEGIIWRRGDAGDPELINVLGPQDMVVANCFLCHMGPAAADKCLRNMARMIKLGGFLFVSGVDLDVRTKVARELGWIPVTDLMREIHEGDASLRRGWPLEYWGLEPFCDNRADWRLRYASVFQVGETARLV